MTWIPVLVREADRGSRPCLRLGHSQLDRYLDFVSARARPNTALATGYDLKVFFSVVGKESVAETVNGYYKSELIYGPDRGPWKTIDDVELATLGWVHWHNTQRLHGHCDDVPPAIP